MVLRPRAPAHGRLCLEQDVGMPWPAPGQEQWQWHSPSSQKFPESSLPLFGLGSVSVPPKVQ